MSNVTQIGALSNLQLELLKAFSHNLEEADLKELRKRLAQFFAERLIKHADISWDDKKWSDTVMDNFLNSDDLKKKQ